MSTFIRTDNTKGEIKLTLEGEMWSKAQDRAFSKLARNLEIKGFRKGQAPRSMAQRFISKGEILTEALESVIDEVYSEALREHKVHLIGQPSMKVEKLDESKAEVTIECPITPEVYISNYHNLGYEVEEVNVTDEDIDKELEIYRKREANMETVEDGTVENGETVVMSFEGTVDGEKFDGGSADNFELEIGSGDFIPGFEEQLVGMKTNEEKDVNVTFPEDYFEKSLAGKNAVFKVKVYEIKKKVLPEVNDDFAKDLSFENVSTVEELKDYIRKGLVEQRTVAAERKADNALLDKLVANTEVEIPESMIDDQVQSIYDQQAAQFQQQGFDMKTYLDYSKTTEEEFKKTLVEDATKQIKMNLALEELANKENIEVTQEDIDAQYAEYATQFGMAAEQLKGLISTDNVANTVFERKIIDYLKNN